MTSTSLVSPHREATSRIKDAFRSIFLHPVLERWVVSLTNGKEEGTLITRLAPNHYQYASGSLREVVRDGLRFRLDISDYNDWRIYFGMEDAQRSVLYGLARPGMVILDVGGNVGEVALRLARRVGPTGCVLSFEPHPVTFSRLSANCALNQFAHLRPVRIGLSDRTTLGRIAEIKESHSGMNRLLSGGDSGSQSQGWEVELHSLDSYVEGAGISRVDLIKVDVEGHEFSVLSGAKGVMRRFRPTLFVEMDARNLAHFGRTPEDVVTLLEKAGYALNDARSGEPVRPGGCSIDDHFDLVARPCAE